jgi:hypothetical protein
MFAARFGRVGVKAAAGDCGTAPVVRFNVGVARDTSPQSTCGGISWSRNERTSAIVV